jgi:hypothetical protein
MYLKNHENKPIYFLKEDCFFFCLEGETDIIIIIHAGGEGGGGYGGIG